MKRLTSLLATTILLSLSYAGYAASPRINPYKTTHVTLDTTQFTSFTRSEVSSESGTTFLNGIIPPSPQAAALARYAEYPVSHTTGIPDITIPLYEIRMGDFTLPVSISYHASGARIDDMATSVGLGWTLNAGGAVTRTILGAPDLQIYPADKYDYKYHDKKNVDALLGSNGVGYNYGVLTGIINGDPMYDTESDRYTFNTGQHTGVFRYSHKSGEFVILDQSSCIVSYSDFNRTSKFLLLCPDNTEVEFSVPERSGMDIDEEGPKHITAWYPGTITTAWGDINFTYIDNGQFYVRRSSSRFRTGYYPKSEWDVTNMSHTTYYYFEVKEKKFPAQNIYFAPKLVKSVEWNGNRIDFDYGPEPPGGGIRPLISMTVTSRAGETVKKVTFGNDDPWVVSSTGEGWRMLRSLDDSAAGRYEFSYDMSSPLPIATSGSDPAERSDSWGFYNGTAGSILSKAQADWLQLGPDSLPKTPAHTNIGWRNRDPSLDHAKLGMLTRVTFPTGGFSEFEYELNQHEQINYGGLRVKATRTGDVGGVIEKRYSYHRSVLYQLPPDSLARHLSYQYIYNTSTWDLQILQYKDVESSASLSHLRQSAPVIYTQVAETVIENGSKGATTTYTYDPLDLEIDPSQTDWRHPSIFETALIDKGTGSPVLVSKTVTDKDRGILLRETTTYIRKDLEEFSTGVRMKSVFNYFQCSIDNEGFEAGGEISQEGLRPEHLLIRETKAVRRVAVPAMVITEYPDTWFTTTVSYTYDQPYYRTTSPMTVTTVNRDERTITTRYEYPFERDDALCAEMMELGYCDWPLSETTISGRVTIARTEHEYGMVNHRLYKFATRSWSAPTRDGHITLPDELPERERVSAYNALGRPLSVIVEGTDETTLEWDGPGDLLLSATAPGGLRTSFTHRPLVGVSSITLPNCHKTEYTYNEAGMLSSAEDKLGVMERYGYSVANHPSASMTGEGNSVTTTRLLDPSGSASVVTRQYLDGLGRPSVLVTGGASPSGNYLYSSVEYDCLGREWRKSLPMAGGSSMEDLSASEVLNMSSATYGDPYAYSDTEYDALDRLIAVTTPGEAWHRVGAGKGTFYSSNDARSVRRYSAPMAYISLSEDGYYEPGTLRSVRSFDEDGEELTVYYDRLGRKVLERRGPDDAMGANDTYFVYNDLGQLRYVLTPQYELSGYKDKFAYEYRYDERGNVVKKFIPGGGYIQYWYDRAGRMSFMQDQNLRERGLHRFFLYDGAGRPVIQGVTAWCDRNEAVNLASFSGSGGFAGTGYSLSDPSRIQSATLESVSYYDDYGFVGGLDGSLASVWGSPATGNLTGTVTYDSEGGKSMSAIYYDYRGNVIETREVMRDGSQRVTYSSYNYLNQPLSTLTMENGISISTDYGYDQATGLPLTTTVSVNGVGQEVSRLSYDDLGRVTSVARGGRGGTVSYGYNLHGQTESIAGPGFSQRLHYTDGPGTPRYNGKVSAMTWTMGNDPTTRGYRYTYNQYGWLTLAEYGERESLDDHRNRYTERFDDFELNGMPCKIQRHGLKADGVYGKVDNLRMTYRGNQLYDVKEDAEPVTTPGSMDFVGPTGRYMQFGYNSSGSLVKDASRGIEDIEYDNLGNPVKVLFSDGNMTENVYSASGERLWTRHTTGLVSAITPFATSPELDPGLGDMSGTETLEYRGQVIYRNGVAETVLFPGGYATLKGGVTFHYYTQDYLGNNRAIVNGSTGALEQVTAYYPYGGIIADLGFGHGLQQFKFGGKELTTANGLNEYDFGARQYWHAIPGFNRIDPMCEKYYWLSPYLYCGNDPVNAVDPDGKETKLWATKLPGPAHIISRPTHTFITVTRPGKGTSYFAYGSDASGPSQIIGGKLTHMEYEQDKKIYLGKNEDPDLIKAEYIIAPPDGMSQEDFDNKVIEVAESFGNEEGITYHLKPLKETQGNCNSSSYTILLKSGVSRHVLEKINQDMPGTHWGFGMKKPWTKSEQKKAIIQNPDENNFLDKIVQIIE